MVTLLLAGIEQAIRRSWSADTGPPESRSQWNPDNPSQGQCGVTAMVLNDLLGGDLIRGEVTIGGQFCDYHWWNRLATGIEIDLTREQFGPDHVISAGIPITRTPPASWRRLREEYERLRDRVFAELKITSADLAGTP